ncbi:MAG: helix-turn-helix domain-containing protein [Euryarchaeota archaeon]|nr:helix-turn-helix domain-containing protein [Euryarchaeota archaeon]
MIDATKLVNDADVEKILLAANERELTVQELSERLGIPIATCYRKVRTLEELGLLKEKSTYIGRDGRIHKFYTSQLEAAYVYYEDGKVRVRFKVILEMAQGYRERYEAIARAKQADAENQKGEPDAAI